MSLNKSEYNDMSQEFVTVLADNAGRVVVPDSTLLFHGNFDRLGSDLLIHNDSAPTLRIPDYFLSDKPADLVGQNGATLRGDLVELLAGPIAPGQYAQAGNTVGASPIGQVETLDGGASVQRVDGTVETLQVGMKVFQQDVLSTDDGGTLSVTFVDGTIFTLASASRMVIDELIFDPEATDNSGGFSLIQGGFVFIAGQVAKTGGMDVSTPSSTMGIRGTTVVVQIGSEDGVVTSEITLAEDPDGTKGNVALFDVFGNLIANITETETKWVVSGADGFSRELARTAQDQIEDSVLIAEAFAAFRAANLRVDNGDTFVTLGDPSAINQSVQDGSDVDTDLDVDSVDEPEAINPIDDIEQTPDTDDGQTFEEGLNTLDDDPDPILVQGVEDAQEDSAVTGQANIENPDGLTLTYGLGDPPSNGTANVDADGNFSFVPSPNFNGEDRFTYTVDGPDGQVAVGTVIVEILPVNDAPEANDQSATIIEDSILSAALDFSDIDGDRLSFAIDTTPQNGELILLQNGTYSYTPNENFEGTDSFVVSISDPEGLSALATVDITVEQANDAPIITTSVEQAAGSLTETQTADTVSGTLAATDPDPGAVLSWSGDATGTFGSFTVDNAGNWEYTLSPTAADVLGEGEVATEVFAVTVSDENATSDVIDVVITLTGTNDVPVITSQPADARGNLIEGQEVITIDGVVSATDPEGNGAIGWSGVSAAQFGVFAISATGAWTYTLDNALADSLVVGEQVTETFTATASDADGGQIEQLIEVVITGTNDLPVLSITPIFESVENQTLNGTLNASDVDGLPQDLVFAVGNDGPDNGSVTVSPDGSFEYTPDPGFVGLERIEYTVTDADGGTTSGRITIAVESDGSNPDNDGVSVGLNADATADAAAGAVTIDINTVEARSVNVAVALDRSGSIGSSAWEATIDAVNAAILDVRALFAGSDTSVDLQIITFATDVQSTEVFDLFDPALLSAVTTDNLPFTGGFTAWDLAFVEAGSFFFSEPADESNILIFVTDGVPTGGSFVEPLAQLQDPNDAYDVTINAFGIGNGYDEDQLRQVDPNAAFLENAEQVTDGFQGIPIFNPELLNLSIVLEADGGDAVEIADETSAALVVEGTNFELPLASIENIADLLGESNVLSITTQFDADNDPGTAEIEFFSLDIIGKADTAQIKDGLAGNDLLFGSDSGDQLTGAAGNDVLLAYGGNDTLSGGLGSDTIRAGGGDDQIIISDAALDGDDIDGGAGRDTLVLEAVPGIDALLSAIELVGVEALDIGNGQQDDLVLSYEDLLDLSDTGDDIINAYLGEAQANTLSIYGDGPATDTLLLENGGAASVVATGSVVDGDGRSLTVYEFQDAGGNALAALGVDSDIAVTTANVPVT